MTQSRAPVPVFSSAVAPHIGAAAGTRWPHACVVEDVIYTAALAGIRADGSLAGTDTPTQFHQALENVRQVLEAGNFTFGDVVKVRVMVREPVDYERLQAARNPFYTKHFPNGDYPASTALVVREMARDGARVEIDVVASRRKKMFDVPGKIVKLIPLDLDAQPLWRLGGDTGDLLWTTGQPGLDLEARLVGEAADEQLARSLLNLGWILEAGRFDWNAVIKLNLFLARIADHESARVVLDGFSRERFPDGDFPAYSVVESGMAPPGMIAEAEVVASRSKSRRSARFIARADRESRSTSASRAGGWAMSALHPGHGSDDVGRQTATAVTSMLAALAEVGSDARNLTQLTLWLSDLAAVNRVSTTCASLLPAMPATAIIRTSFPSKETLVAVEGIAT